MTTITDLADEIGLTAMRVSQIAKALRRSSLPLSDLDAIKILAVFELRKEGFATGPAIEMLTQFDLEIRDILLRPEHRLWVIFIETQDIAYQVAAQSPNTLTFHLDSGPAAVLALDNPVRRARDRFERFKARRAAA